MLNLFSGYFSPYASYLGKVAESGLFKEMQRLADITSFKGSVSKFSVAKEVNGKYVHIEDYDIVSNGLTFKKWKELGMPKIDDVIKILGYA